MTATGVEAVMTEAFKSVHQHLQLNILPRQTFTQTTITCVRTLGQWSQVGAGDVPWGCGKKTNLVGLAPI